DDGPGELTLQDRNQMTHRFDRTVPLLVPLTLFIAGPSFGQKAEPARPPAQAIEAPGQALVIMGLDLSAAPYAHSEKDVPDLYQPSGKQRADVFFMPLEKEQPAATAANPQPPSQESIFLKYPTSAKRFYIEYRSDRAKPETERIYGPFAGDPFDRFRL